MEVSKVFLASAPPCVDTVQLINLFCSYLMKIIGLNKVVKNYFIFSLDNYLSMVAGHFLLALILHVYRTVYVQGKNG